MHLPVESHEADDKLPCEEKAEEVLHDLKRPIRLRQNRCLVQLRVDADPQRIQHDDDQRRHLEIRVPGDRLRPTCDVVVVEHIVLRADQRLPSFPPHLLGVGEDRPLRYQGAALPLHNLLHLLGLLLVRLPSALRLAPCLLGLGALGLRPKVSHALRRHLAAQGRAPHLLLRLGYFRVEVVDVKLEAAGDLSESVVNGGKEIHIQRLLDLRNLLQQGRVVIGHGFVQGAQLEHRLVEVDVHRGLSELGQFRLQRCGKRRCMRGGLRLDALEVLCRLRRRRPQGLYALMHLEELGVQLAHGVLNLADAPRMSAILLLLVLLQFLDELHDAARLVLQPHAQLLGGRLLSGGMSGDLRQHGGQVHGGDLKLLEPPDDFLEGCSAPSVCDGA
mmetsp:Transcript_106089/g.306890  ORF Transcript_106089/g.306890 Transcript_106089/m.306890 type:complete len:388 (-) Transcript_106089:520-1683(-)